MSREQDTKKPEGSKQQVPLKAQGSETAEQKIENPSGDVNGRTRALEKTVERLKKINEIARSLTSLMEPSELMKFFGRTTADLLNADRVAMRLKGPGRNPEAIRYRKGSEAEYLQGASCETMQEFSDPAGAEQIRVTGEESSSGIKNNRKMFRIVIPLTMRGTPVGSMLIENADGGRSFPKDDLELLSPLSTHCMVALENAWLYEGLKNNYFATIQSLVNALEANDRFTKGHSERVRLLSVELGRQMGLELKEIELLEHASILHDIGKIGIDNFVLQKQGKLTAKEYSLVKTHPLIGDEILGPITTLDGVRKTILQHHERYDGKGYPYGLMGEEITLPARVLSVVDTFDAMMTDRPYRKAITIDKVKEEVRVNAGTQFDPRVVHAFIDMLAAREAELLSAAGYDALYSSL